MEYSECLTENSCLGDAWCCWLRLIFFWKCQCLLPFLQVAPLPPSRQSPSVAQVGAASVPAELSFLPAESWFVWLTDGVPALARMCLVKGFLFEACRGSLTPQTPAYQVLFMVTSSSEEVFNWHCLLLRGHSMGIFKEGLLYLFLKCQAINSLDNAVGSLLGRGDSYCSLSFQIWAH